MRKTSSNSVRVCYPERNLEELKAEIRRRLPALADKLPLRQVVLFGSWASGRATAFSDIDLLVVYVGSSREDAYQIVRRHLKLRGLEPHVYTEEEAARLQATLARMTRAGISLI